MKKGIFLLSFLAIAALTAVVYLLIFSAYGPLFYTNLVVALIFEFILLGNMPFKTDKSLLDVPNASLALLLVRYATVSFLFTTAYTVYHLLTPADKPVEERSHIALYVGLAVIAILYIVRFAFTAYAGQVVQADEAQRQALSDDRRNARADFRSLQRELKAALLRTEQPAEWQQAQLQTLRSLVDKADATPTSQLARAHDEADAVCTNLAQLTQLCRKFQRETEADALQSAFADALVELQQAVEALRQA